MARHPRLDVWRGLCLVDVVLVHLAFAGLGFPGPLDEAIKQYTRFAAGGFVFLAGLTIGVAFWPNVLRSETARWQVYEWLWRRAALLVAVELAASLALVVLDPLRWFPIDPDTPMTDALLGIVLFQRPGALGGILILYAVILALLPAVFELRRRGGEAPVVAFSLGLYAIAWVTGGLRWPHGEFPVAYWQPIFVAGLVAARAWSWIEGGGHRRAVLWAAVATGVFAGVFVLRHGPVFGIETPARLIPLDFSKNPLQPGGLLWYLAIVQVVLAWTHLVWERWLLGTSATAWLALLGRHSLLFYTAHVFTEIPIMELVWQTWPPALVRVMLAAVDLTVLTALCAAAEGAFAPLATPGWMALARRGAVAAVAASLAMLVVSHAPIPEVEVTGVGDADVIGDAPEPASDLDMSIDVDTPGDEVTEPDAEPDVTIG